jgi:hypothetical protein
MRIICFSAILTLLLCPMAHSQQRRHNADPFRQFVTRLPEVDRIEVVEVRAFLTDEVKNADCKQPGLICVPGNFPLKVGEIRTLTGDDADRLSTIWRNLKRNYSPSDSWCFSPDRILRFYQGDKLVLETEICVFCHLIRLPGIGIVNLSGSREKYDGLRGFLMPYSRITEGIERFKREMMPKVGQRIAVIGFPGMGKPALSLAFGDWEIYIRTMNLSEANRLNNLGCNVVIKATGTLQYWPGPEPLKPGEISQQALPENFFFAEPDIKVLSFEPWPRLKHRRRSR